MLVIDLVSFGPNMLDVFLSEHANVVIGERTFESRGAVNVHQITFSGGTGQSCFSKFLGPIFIRTCRGFSLLRGEKNPFKHFNE